MSNTNRCQCHAGAAKLTIECTSDWATAVNSKKESDFKSDSSRAVYLIVNTEAITNVIHQAEFQLNKGDGGTCP